MVGGLNKPISDKGENGEESPQMKCEGNVEFDNKKNEQSSMRRFRDLTATTFTAVKNRSMNRTNASGNDREDEGTNDSFDDNPGVCRWLRHMRGMMEG